MARGRVIDKRISKSRKFAALKSDRSRVLYLMIYPHLDVEGRINGDPEEIKEDCCPKLRYSVQKIAESIIELANIGLINLYEVDGHPYIQYEKFDCFQTGIRKDRESPSFCPNPDEVRTNSGATPLLYLRLNLKLMKEGKKTESVYFDFDKQTFINISEKDLRLWASAYPACNVKAELLKMSDWLISNPNKKKSNYRKFISNWLSRQQDRGGTEKGRRPPDTVGQSKPRQKTDAEKEFDKAYEAKRKEIESLHAQRIEAAKKKGDQILLEGIENVIKEELAEWTEGYHGGI